MVEKKNISEKEKEYLLAVVNSIPRELMVISPDFIIMAANKFAKDIYGEDIVGKKCYEIYYGMDKPCPKCKIIQILEGEENREEKSEFSNFYLEEKVTLFPIVGVDCEHCMVKLDFDITEMDRLEKKLHLSNTFLHNLILSSVDAVIAADKKGRIFIFNDAASKILGYKREEALTSVDIRDLYPGNGAKEVMKKLRSKDFGGPGKLKSHKVKLLTKDGELVPVELNASIIYENGVEVATLGFFRDLRETLKMERELEETRMQLYQSSKMAAMGNLAAGVAHQLNNPLSGIILFSELLLEEDIDDHIKEDLLRILENAKRCKDTVKELLEFSRQSDNKTFFVDINKVINRTLFLLEKHPLFKSIKVVRDFENNLPEIKCDLQQLNHVFMNIIWNAAQAMEGEGVLTIKTRMVPEKNMIRILFCDTGPGIPEDILPYIFDPFFSTKKQGDGVGLGLSIAYRIIEGHGGKILAYNLEDGGACFEVLLYVSKHEEDNLE